jgi:hypothetical protein
MKWSIIGLLCIAIVLLIADRLIRIQPYIQKVHIVNEPFQSPPLSARRCGVDMLSCTNTTKCGNGFCISTDPAPLVNKYPLPVLP